MTQPIADPRPLPKFSGLPNYAAAWRRWGAQAEVARPLLFLGVKLTEADDYRSRLAAVDVTRLGIPAQRAFSRDLDAFVFVTYGGLDAFCHVVAGRLVGDAVPGAMVYRSAAPAQRHQLWQRVSGAAHLAT
jgi:hypothetical protein